MDLYDVAVTLLNHVSGTVIIFPPIKRHKENKNPEDLSLQF